MKEFVKCLRPGHIFMREPTEPQSILATISPKQYKALGAAAYEILGAVATFSAGIGGFEKDGFIKGVEAGLLMYLFTRTAWYIGEYHIIPPTSSLRRYNQKI